MRFGMGVICTFLLAAAIAVFFWPADPSEKRFADVTVVFICVAQKDDPAIIPMQHGLDWAKNDFGCNLKVWWCGWYAEEILENFQAAILYQPDVICIPGYENEDGFESLLEEARSKGILVTTYHTPLPSLMPKYQADGMGYVGHDQYGAGIKMAKRAALAFGMGANSNVLVFGNSRLGADLRLRSQGLLDGAEATGANVTLIDMRDYWHGAPSRGVAAALQEYLEKHPKPDFILFDSGGTEGLMEAFDETGLRPGEITVTSFDASTFGVRAVREGYVQLVYAYQTAFWSYFAVLQACLSVKHKLPGIEIITPGHFITPEDMDLLEFVSKFYEVE